MKLTIFLIGTIVVLIIAIVLIYQSSHKGAKWSSKKKAIMFVIGFVFLAGGIVMLFYTANFINIDLNTAEEFENIPLKVVKFDEITGDEELPFLSVHPIKIRDGKKNERIGKTADFYLHTEEGVEYIYIHYLYPGYHNFARIRRETNVFGGWRWGLGKDIEKISVTIDINRALGFE